MDIHIDAEGLQQAILNQIASTTFGEALAKAVNRAFDRKGWGDRTLIEEAAEAEVKRYVATAVRAQLDERLEEIEGLIRGRLTTEALSEITLKAVDRLLEKA